MNSSFFGDQSKRKYVCFICGMAYVNFEEFTEHIVENHEEGREYIRCPLDRCQACVRDLRQHFKSKHPHDSLPKKGQMKALIWKDQKDKNGKLKQRKPRFREGYLISAKNGGKEMHYRSGMECDVYEILEAMPEVIGYEVEPFKVQYSFMGNTHEYNPDLKVLFDNGRVEIWEIKPSNQTDLPKNNAKWVACQQYCESRGLGFMVLTEVGMNKLKKNLKINN